MSSAAQRAVEARAKRQAQLRRQGERRQRGRPGARVGRYHGQAQTRLRRFRRGSILAIAITAWILMVIGLPEAEAQDDGAQSGAAVEQELAPEEATDASPELDLDLGRSAEEAASTLRDMLYGFAGILPQLLVAIGILALAALAQSLSRPLLRRVLASWARADAFAALAGILIWLLAVSAALTVVAGDPRTLLGSVGLIGLALSWALQAPIESFTAWLLNSFRAYYRVGDRIGVGEVFGDVYRIDFLTTTVWEAGGPEKPVQGAQPTGALVTFPNSEILRANVVNYTRDFPYVWDEVDVGVANESDLAYVRDVLLAVAREVVGEHMAGPVQRYRALLSRSRLDHEIADEPQVFFSTTDAWTNATIRYLVDARRRRRMASDLIVAVSQELAKPSHAGKLLGTHPTARITVVPADAPRGG